ncbi:MAG: YlmC/YmxH family sporulation protein [Anaeromicrobium sp.]|jgi:YlmC/YmxH family sporulation protein|uniref:YlmC/YmxH family sporulation protein n=1 Tax=Anaeromicrobium sp. TaxID=1929132 RepID=UPI0025FD87DA|nr:YlmC/YmxH family sporulation protein [Anaeromicrobium sp.]MCT4592912.1 YlmC/YmxH family sporulation protein [Anaeromicrobium sp.]
MISTAELREKEIINMSDGKKLGFISDIEINLEKGRVVSVVVPTEGKFLGIFGKYNEYVIPWREINKIGVDVVLVNSKNVVETNMNNEEEYEEIPVEKEIFIKKEGNI